MGWIVGVKRIGIVVNYTDRKKKSFSVERSGQFDNTVFG